MAPPRLAVINERIGIRLTNHCSINTERMFGEGETMTERHIIENLLKAAERALDHDTEVWTELATGQDTEEAEASGVLEGQVAGLKAALIAIDKRNIREAAHYLDLEIPA